MRQGLRITTLDYSTHPLDIARMARDASHFYLRPQGVFTPKNVHEIAQFLRSTTTPVTFRAGGTSLSGQGVTSGTMIDVRKLQQRVKVVDNGNAVWCEPGAVLRTVNAFLAPYGKKLGPDPASETACTIGGVVANNSSGMTSGHLKTAYYTMRSIEFVLPSGTHINTADPQAKQDFITAEPALAMGLESLRDRIRNSTGLVAKVQHQFSMKNTMGYSFNAFLDYDHPLDIFAHLLVGSEGTLAYIASATLATVPILPHVASAFCVFDNPDQATAAIPLLSDAGAVAVEMLDSVSLNVSMRDEQAAGLFGDLVVKDHAALLVEVQAETSGMFNHAVGTMQQTINKLRLAVPTALTTDRHVRDQMWQTRRVLYAAVAGARPDGTMPIIEDIVVPHAALPQTVVGLQQILREHHYQDPVIFGHAKDANLHFVIAPVLHDKVERANFEHFTHALIDLVLDHDGSLKAEHGTGRIMAPFVERQFGAELYGMMREVKRLADPKNILNPGTIITDDPDIHTKDLKVFPQIDAHIDDCVECGYCGPVCPSRLVTTTPRQRITLLRELVLAEQEHRVEDVEAITSMYPYMAIDTCAADSLCVLQCPMGIDTGAFMKQKRAERLGGGAQHAGDIAAKHWSGLQKVLRGGLRAGSILPPTLLTHTTSTIRHHLGADPMGALQGANNSTTPTKQHHAASQTGTSPTTNNNTANKQQHAASQTGTSPTTNNNTANKQHHADTNKDIDPYQSESKTGLREDSHNGIPRYAKVPSTWLNWIPKVPNQHIMQGATKPRSVALNHPNVVTKPAQPISAVWLPSCVHGVFGAAQGDGVMAAVLDLLQQTKVLVAMPDGIDGLCCTTMWSSKGLVKGATTMANQVFDEVWGLTKNGTVPLLSDASSCSHGFASIGKYLEGARKEQFAQVSTVDLVSFVANTILPSLTITKDQQFSRIAVHPTCSGTHLGVQQDLETIAKAIAKTPVIAPNWGCCGSAGDRFMLFPELAEGAYRMERATIDSAGPFEAYVSTNRTCEMGLQTQTSHRWQHIVEVLATVVNRNA